MCGIFATFDNVLFLELFNNNKSRGSFSLSITNINTDCVIENCYKSFDINGDIEKTKNYKIGHLQAPTNGMVKDITRIHPAESDSKYLWHNGIIKENCIKELSDIYNIEMTNWDTLFILRLIHKIGIPRALELLDGSFACIFYNNNQLFMFRNSIAPLFIDNNLNISSIKLNDTFELIRENCIFELNLKLKKYKIIDKFINNKSPYFFYDG
jgi:glutamine phosphoribosylpyrophosphate amidotransferase